MPIFFEQQSSFLLATISCGKVRIQARKDQQQLTSRLPEFFTERIAGEIHTGLNYPIDGEVDISRPFCATNECRWPTFNTPEICTKAWHVANQLNFEMKDGRMVNIPLPNGVFLDAEPQRTSRTDFVWLSSGHGPVSHEANSSKLSETTLTNVLVFYLSGSTPPAAVEVLFHLCVNRYNVTMSQNVVS